MTTVEEIEEALESLSFEERRRVATFCLNLFEEAEETEDLRAFREALNEPGENVSWTEVKRENGLCD